MAGDAQRGRARAGPSPRPARAGLELRRRPGQLSLSAVSGRSELTAMGAGEVALGIAARRFSAVEVVSAHVARQNDLQPKLNAIAVALHDQAIAAAKAADQGMPGDGQKLYGVPISVKEVFDVAGTASTAGLAGWAARVQDDDAELGRRLRDAGAIVTAKTNVPQLVLYPDAAEPLDGR